MQAPLGSSHSRLAEMHWLAPTEMDIFPTPLEKRFWDATGRFDFVLANPPFNAFVSHEAKH